VTVHERSKKQANQPHIQQDRDTQITTAQQHNSLKESINPNPKKGRDNNARYQSALNSHLPRPSLSKQGRKTPTQLARGSREGQRASDGGSLRVPSEQGISWGWRARAGERATMPKKHFSPKMKHDSCHSQMNSITCPARARTSSQTTVHLSPSLAREGRSASSPSQHWSVQGKPHVTLTRWEGVVPVVIVEETTGGVSAEGGKVVVGERDGWSDECRDVTKEIQRSSHYPNSREFQVVGQVHPEAQPERQWLRVS